MPTLRVTADSDRVDLPEPVKLTDRAVLIGRAPSCEVRIHDNLASRKHCRVEPLNGGWHVTDLDSRNGTLLNHEPLKDGRLLEAGDVITIGEHHIAFDAVAPRAPALPSQTADQAAGIKVHSPETASTPWGAPGTVYVLNIRGPGIELTHVLEAPVTTIGRGDDADVTIEETLASRVHAQFEVKMSGIKVIDLESRNGTKINGQTVNQKFLEQHDIVSIGDTEIRVSARPPLTTAEIDPGQATVENANRTPLPGALPAMPERSPCLRYVADGSEHVFHVLKDEIVIGRSEKATLTIPEKMASRKHCKIHRQPDGSYDIEDLGSRNGTKINGRRLKGDLELVNGDLIEIGDVALTFLVPEPGAPMPQVSSPSQAPGPRDVTIAEKRPEKPRRRARRRGAGSSGGGGAVVGAIIGVIALLGAAMLFMNVDFGSSTPKRGDSPPPPPPNSIRTTPITVNRNRNTPGTNRPNPPVTNVNRPGPGPGPGPRINRPVGPGPVGPGPGPVGPGPGVNRPPVNVPDNDGGRALGVTLRLVEDAIDRDAFGPAVTALSKYIDTWDGRTTEALLNRADNRLTEVHAEAKRVFNQRYLPDLQKRTGADKKALLLEIERKFKGIESLLALARSVANQ